MKIKHIIALLVSISMLALSCISAYAAPWTPPTNVRIVQKSNVDNVRIFSTIQAALDSITNASASNPYLVKIMPGVYDIGSSSVQMKEYVDIEGSGENITTIVSVSDVVLGASNTELRFLTVKRNGGAGSGGSCIVNMFVSPKITNVTVKNSGLGGSEVGIFNYGGSPEMVNVTVNAKTGISNQNVTNCRMRQVRINASIVGIEFYGVSGLSASFILVDSIIEAENSGIYISGQDSSFVMTNVTVTAPSGIYVYGFINSSAKIDNSSITGTSETIHVNTGGDSEMKFYVGNSKLAGGPIYNPTNVICAGVIDENYVFYQNTCPQ